MRKLLVGLLWPLAAVYSQDNLSLNPVTVLEKSRAPEFTYDEAPTLDRGLRQTRKLPLVSFLNGGYGFRAKLGRPAPTSGFAAGVEYNAGNYTTGQVLFRTSARASTGRYLHADAEVAFPRLAGEKIFANVTAVHRNFPQLRYYGPGAGSRAEGITNFRLEDTRAEATAGVRPLRIVRLGATASYLKINTGPGTSSRYFSIKRIYAPQQATGLDRQTDYAAPGVFAEIDYTDHVGSPRSGGIYYARLTNYVDQQHGAYSFRGLDIDLRQFLPLFHEQRVFALRAHGTFTDTPRGNLVPFYMQPTLGGPETMRAYPAFRFYGNNSMYFNAEYRWKLSTGIEMALFTDAGKVFPNRRQIDLRGLQFCYGAGLRLNYRQGTFMRLDGGCGREGCQVWLRFHENY